MNEGEDKLERLNEILIGLESGRIKLEDCVEEIRELVGPRFAPMAALVEADSIYDRYDAGEVTAAEAMAVAREHADAYPAVPILFMYCSFYAHELEEELDSIGYIALYKLKSAQIEEITDFGRHLEWEEMMQPLLAGLEKDEELLSVWPYLEEGGGHLVNHFLVQEITEGVLDPDREWIDAVLTRFDDLEPLLSTCWGTS